MFLFWSQWTAAANLYDKVFLEMWLSHKANFFSQLAHTPWLFHFDLYLIKNFLRSFESDVL